MKLSNEFCCPGEEFVVELFFRYYTIRRAHKPNLPYKFRMRYKIEVSRHKIEASKQNIEASRQRLKFQLHMFNKQPFSKQDRIYSRYERQNEDTLCGSIL